MTKPNRNRKGGAKKRTTPANNFASVVETVSLTDISGNTPYSLETNLSLFERASAVALNFQEYRIVKTEYRLLADDNIYNNAGNDGTIPYLYTVPSKGGESVPYFDLSWMEQNGAKPRKMTSIVKMAPTPRVGVSTFQEGSSQPSVGLLGKTSPWIRTINIVALSPVVDSTSHKGVLLYLHQKTAGSSQLRLELDCTVTIQFRRPLAKYESSPGDTQTITVLKKV